MKKMLKKRHNQRYTQLLKKAIAASVTLCDMIKESTSRHERNRAERLTRRFGELEDWANATIVNQEFLSVPLLAGSRPTGLNRVFFDKLQTPREYWYLWS